MLEELEGDRVCGCASPHQLALREWRGGKRHTPRHGVCAWDVVLLLDGAHLATIPRPQSSGVLLNPGRPQAATRQINLLSSSSLGMCDQEKGPHSSWAQRNVLFPIPVLHSKARH